MDFLRNLFRSFFPEKPEANLGALIDDRTPAERAKDHTFEETVAAGSIEAVRWIEKKWATFRKFAISDQNGSGSCVAQTLALILGILLWLRNGKRDFVRLSATHIYQRRSNRPFGGMNGVESFEIARRGVTLEALAPSQKMTDAQMDAAIPDDFERSIGEEFKLENYVQLQNLDLETIASIIQKTEKAVMVWFYFTSAEWKRDVPVVKDPKLTLHGARTLRHSVSAVDFTLYKGKKALVIQDSWGPETGIDGQRIITEDFFRQRCWFAAYPIRFVFQPSGDRPTFDGSTTSLQDCLKAEGVFPLNIESTGLFGSITTKAVKDFQKKYGLEQVGTVGPKTAAKLSQLYP